MKHLLTTFAILMVALSTIGCSTRTMAEAEATKWIAAHTPEVIGPDSKIRIEITDSLRQSISEDIALSQAIKFSPSIRGEWSDAGSYWVFTPNEKALKQGKEYKCRVDIGGLTRRDSLGVFAFDFYVEERTAELQIKHIRIDPNDANYAIVEGCLLLNHDTDIEAIENNFLIKDEPEAKIDIQHQYWDTNNYDFKISNLKRQPHSRTTQIIFKANNIGAGERISESVAIEGKSFRVMWTELHNASYNPYIEIEFSSPLSSEQGLDGLITIDQAEVTKIYVTNRGRTNAKVYFKRNGTSNLDLRISNLVKCAEGDNLKREYHEIFEPTEIPSAIEMPLSGTILPDGNNLTLPFRAVNLAAVDVKVVKIYADNVLMFLQDNELDEDYDLCRAGRLIYHKTVRLDNDESLDLHQWQNFSVDLKGLFRQERGAIYSVSITFRDEYSLMNHYGDSRELQFPMQDGVSQQDESNYYYYNHNGYNLLASNLGLIVKGNDENRLWCAVSDIMTTTPLAGIKVTAYDYQLREIGGGYTSEAGFADFNISNKPFVVIATNGVSTSYLKVTDGAAMSTSTFDVSGKKNESGIKSFIYGERGVWRPGDTIYLTMMVEDKMHSLPKNHPVTMELYTPQGHLYKRLTNNNRENGMYVFEIPTAEDAPTGKWNATFTVGEKSFREDVRIETIKPNRIKINIETPDVIHSGNEEKITIQANWLTGGPATGLDTDLSMVVYNNPAPFKEFKQYTFSNPLISFNSTQIELFAEKLDSAGYISKPKLPVMGIT